MDNDNNDWRQFRGNDSRKFEERPLKFRYLHSLWYSDSEFREWGRTSLRKEPILPAFSEAKLAMKNAIIGMQMENIDLERTVGEKIRELSRQVAMKYVTIAPIRALPDELLGRILAEHISCHSFQDAMWSPALRTCRRWRHVALSTPSCWIRLQHPDPIETSPYRRTWPFQRDLFIHSKLAGSLPLQLLIGKVEGNDHGRLRWPDAKTTEMLSAFQAC